MLFFMKFGLLWFNLGTFTLCSCVRVLPPYLHHSSRLFFSSEFYLTFSPPSILSLSPISCKSKTKELFTVKTKFWKHHLLCLSGKSSPLTVCNSSHPKIVYKSTLTIKLSPFSVASPCLSEDYNNTFYLCVLSLLSPTCHYSNLYLL